jgi:hypothetical protein
LASQSPQKTFNIPHITYEDHKKNNHSFERISPTSKKISWQSRKNMYNCLYYKIQINHRNEINIRYIRHISESRSIWFAHPLKKTETHVKLNFQCYLIDPNLFLKWKHINQKIHLHIFHVHCFNILLSTKILAGRQKVGDEKVILLTKTQEKNNFF